MLLLDYHNVLIQSLLTERFSEYFPRSTILEAPANITSIALLQRQSTRWSPISTA